MTISILNRAFALAVCCSLSTMVACVKTTAIPGDAQGNTAPGSPETGSGHPSKRGSKARDTEQEKPVALSDKEQAEKDITAKNYPQALKALEAEISATELPLKEH